MSQVESAKMDVFLKSNVHVTPCGDKVDLKSIPEKMSTLCVAKVDHPLPDHPHWVDDERAPNNASPIYPKAGILPELVNTRPLWHDVCFGRATQEMSRLDSDRCRAYNLEQPIYVDYEFDSGAGSPVESQQDIDLALQWNENA